MQVYVNGEYKELGERLSLLELLNILNLPIQRIAVELNRSVVRRAEWESTQLKDDDCVEIVHFVGGGSRRSHRKENECRVSKVSRLPGKRWIQF